MRLIFLGTASFAMPSLDVTAAAHDVAAVVTQPDRPGSRGRPAPRPVAHRARALGIRVLTPARIRDVPALDALAALRPDVLVVAAYGQILPAALLEIPPHGAVNVHASLLPRWRGASPVAHAILAGDAQTGVTIMRMDEGLDTGPIYARRSMEIAPEATTPGLTDALAYAGAALLSDVLVDIEQGRAVATPQPSEGATYAPRLHRTDGEVRWDEDAAAYVDRKVRALNPWPGVTTVLEGAPVRLLEGGVPSAPVATASPGDVVGLTGESALVAACDGVYRIDRVLPPGSRAMTAAAFLRGRRTATQP